jgi:hypothetical protein
MTIVGMVKRSVQELSAVCRGCTSKPVIAICHVIYPFFDMAAHITRNVAHLAAERGFTVAEVETRAGMRRGFLSPVDGSKVRVTGIAAVADVLGVETGDVVHGRT